MIGISLTAPERPFRINKVARLSRGVSILQSKISFILLLLPVVEFHLKWPTSTTFCLFMDE